MNKEERRVQFVFGELIPREVRERIGELPREMTELRLRAERPAEIVCMGEGRLCAEPISAELLERTADSLASHSLYAREEELSQGFFTIAGGCRVGVCGRMTVSAQGQICLTHISSLCVRAARQIKGAADKVMDALYENAKPVSALVISPPGLGKTTLLRDIARQLSDGGMRVALADERGELAGCVLGMPTLDVGQRTDVMDGCPKRIAMPLLVRAMSPEVIVTDELGHCEDAQAVIDAMRCGVQVIASVHADDVQSAARRLKGLEIGRFARLIVLGDGVGQIKRIVCADQT